MTTIIKNGTVVTADLTYKADIRIEIGQNDVLLHVVAGVVG